MDDRVALAAKIRSVRHEAAARLSEWSVTADPERTELPDDQVRHSCAGQGFEDALRDLDALASAVEFGAEAAFAEYVGAVVGLDDGDGAQRPRQREALGRLGHVLRELDAGSPAADGCLSVARRALKPGATPPFLREPEVAFREAILAGHRQAALDLLLGLLRDGWTLATIYQEVVGEALRDTGRRWASGELTVAQEHLATAITHSLLGRLAEHVPPAERSRGRALVTGVEGELHQLGLRMLADVLEEDGWAVGFLGTDLPDDGILRLVDDLRPDVVAVGATMLFNVPRLRRLVARLRQATAAPRVLVGGAALRRVPDPASAIDADAYRPDLASGLEWCRTLARTRAG